jgi:hypothetical protein
LLRRASGLSNGREAGTLEPGTLDKLFKTMMMASEASGQSSWGGCARERACPLPESKPRVSVSSFDEKFSEAIVHNAAATAVARSGLRRPADEPGGDA